MDADMVVKKIAAILLESNFVIAGDKEMWCVLSDIKGLVSKYLQGEEERCAD